MDFIYRVISMALEETLLEFRLKCAYFSVDFHNFLTSLFARFVVDTNGHTDLFTISTFINNTIHLQSVTFTAVWLIISGPSRLHESKTYTDSCVADD